MLLELSGIQKHFGGVTALRNGNLTVEPGQVHLLMGENGAGKSTLMKIVAGMYSPDAGGFKWRGQSVCFTSPADAAAHGIAMVHQESLLAPHLTVAENLFLGREPRLPFGYVNRAKMMQRAKQMIADHGFPLQPEWQVGRLSPAGKQLVEICRAVLHGSSLLIFDEPTSSLSEAETREVFRIANNLKQRGMGVIYITHRLDELRSVGDSVTVLRDGETVHCGPLSALTTDGLIKHMVGREVAALFNRQRTKPGVEVLRIEQLSRKPLLKDVSLSVHAGEIVGLAGLVGAGRTELCRAIFGIDPIDSGQIFIDGKPVRIPSPRHAVAHGLALIPEDRQRAGLATSLPISWNTTMASLGTMGSYGWLDLARQRTTAEQYRDKLHLKCANVDQPAGRLSGGNQQKVVIAKWLATGARIFLFDEPTRGIDVGAKAEVFEVMDQLARNGAAILMVSSELQEITQIADRILVMRQGRLTGELPAGASQESIMRLAAFEKESGLLPDSEDSKA